MSSKYSWRTGTMLIALTMGSAAFAGPITIASVTNANPVATGIGVAATTFSQEGWTQATDYFGVSISAWLFGNFVNGAYLPSSGTAYLTSSLGLNVSQSFVFPDPTGSVATKVLLFSGLNLPGATYFLTLASTDTLGGAWASDLQQSSTILTASGVTVANAKYSPQANVNSANPPTSTFFQVNPTSHDFFEVVGTPVPEPSFVVLMGLGLFSLIARAKATFSVR